MLPLWCTTLLQNRAVHSDDGNPARARSADVFVGLLLSLSGVVFVPGGGVIQTDVGDGESIEC